MKTELRRIRRKANRFFRRHHDRTPAKFAKFDIKNRGHFLHG